MEEKMEFGDEKFREYINNINNSEESDSLCLILDTLRFQIKTISDLYKKSLDTYFVLEKEDPVKKSLANYINQLTNHSLRLFEQLSYILVDIQDTDEDDDEDKNEGDINDRE